MTCPARRRGLWLRLTGFLLVFVTLFSVSTFSGSTPVRADELLRTQIPLVAGSVLWTDSGTFCTVGAVLKRNGWDANVSTYTAAFRYLILAKHCAPEIGAQLGLGRQPVGIVTWVSATDDVELVQVPPEVTRPEGCYGSHGCFVGSRIAPRAVGRVVMAVHGRERAIPMRYMAIPGGDERFCTSGAVSRINCNWVSERERPWTWGDDGGQIARSTNAIGVEAGDSGGPVIGSEGELYGIIQRFGTGAFVNLMQYLPIATFMAQTDHAYDIAPL